MTATIHEDPGTTRLPSDGSLEVEGSWRKTPKLTPHRLMASPSPSSGRRPARLAPAAPAAGLRRRAPRAADPLSAFFASSAAPAAGLVVAVLRLLRGGDPAEAAADAFPYIVLLLLFWSVRLFQLSPPGSAARRRARFAIWVLTSSLTASATWKWAKFLPLPLAVAGWIMAAAGIGFGLYLLLFY
ncbi:hypothetical protein ACP70R_041860 [Stipagrostis hirtigluma subsp. patula]